MQFYSRAISCELSYPQLVILMVSLNLDAEPNVSLLAFFAESLIYLWTNTRTVSWWMLMMNHDRSSHDTRRFTQVQHLPGMSDIPSELKTAQSYSCWVGGSQPSKQKLVHPELPKNTEAENLWKFNLQSSSKLGSFIQYTFPFQEGILKNALCILGHEVAGASAEDEMWLGGVEMIGYFKLFQG